MTIGLTDPLEYIQQRILCGRYERAESAWLWRLLHPGDTFVDVGANIGYYTLLGSARVGEEGRVYAVEPSPQQFEALLANLRRNRLANVSAQQIALARKSHPGTLHVSRNANQGLHSLMPRTDVLTQGIGIQCVALDDFVAAHAVHKIDVMKIDVEGAEFEVLQGAAAAISRLVPRVLLVEICDALLQRFDASAVQVKRFLTERHYKLYRICDDTRLEECPVESSEHYTNLLAMDLTRVQLASLS